MGDAEQLDLNAAARGLDAGELAEVLDLNAAARGLDAGELAEVLDFIGYLRIKRERQALPPVLAEAPLDDEPLTDEEIAEIEAAKAEYAEMGGISHEQLKAELGL